MALITTPAASNANAYISLADANDYHTLRGNTAWTGTDAEKEAAIVRATFAIDNTYRRGFTGIKSTSTQALEWPRSNATDSSGYPIDDDVLPAALTNATAEAALIELTTSGALSPSYTAGVRMSREKVDVIEVEQEFGSEYTGRESYSVIEQYIGALLSRGKYQMRILRG